MLSFLGLQGNNARRIPATAIIMSPVIISCFKEVYLWSVKRTVIILLSAVYLLSGLGIAASSHYCCGILQSTTLFRDTKPDCKMASHMKDCCKTKKQYFKVKDQHFGTPAFSLNANLFHTIIQSIYHLDLSLAYLNIGHISINSHGPPNRLKTCIYIQNCTYRIWPVISLSAFISIWPANNSFIPLIFYQVWGLFDFVTIQLDTGKQPWKRYFY